MKAWPDEIRYGRRLASEASLFSGRAVKERFHAVPSSGPGER